MNLSFISRCRSRRCRRFASKRKAMRSLKISDRADINQTRIKHELVHQIALVMVVFEEKPSPGRQPLRSTVHHFADRGQPILSPTQGQMRFMVTNHSLKASNHGTWDVRRIADHQIQMSPPALQGSPPGAELQQTVVVWNASLEIAFRQMQGLRTDVDAMP